jgi:hypothetical protein
VLFLLPIPITLVIGLVWASWRSRPPRPADPTTTVEEWARTIRVLATPPAPPPSERRKRELVRSI